MSLPLFTDEAIYVRWSQIARYDPSWRFISLTDGKQPLFVWLTMTVMRIIQDPLLAGRLVSVGAGLVSLIGLFFLGRELFKNVWVGIVSSVLYLVFPMALVYDRMALYEALVGAFAIWSLYFELLLIRKPRLDISLLLGMVLGGGVLTKTSAFFSIYLLPFSIILLNVKTKKWLIKFIKWLGFASLSVIMAYGFYSILRLSPFLHIINDKNSIFVYPIRDWLKHPLEFFWGNLLGEWDWFITYISWPVIVLIVGSLSIYRQYTKEKLLLLIWFFIPFVALALFGRVLYPRFIFFMVLPLLPLAAQTIVYLYQRFKRPLLRFLVLLLFASSFFYSDYFILTNFAKAPIPRLDLEQYINSWPAGGGIKEATAFFSEEAKQGPIFVSTQGTFGLMPASFELYLVDNPNIKLSGFWPVGEMPPKEVVDASEKMPTYIVFYQPCPLCEGPGFAPPSWNLTLFKRYTKGIGNAYLSIYKVKP